MQQWEEYNRGQQAAAQRHVAEQLEAITCPKCESTWFEQVRAFQYKSDHHIILGQDVPTRRTGMIPYIVLRCVHCSNLVEPRVIHNTRDIAGNDYDDLLDTLEGKNDKRPKEEDKINETISSLRLHIAGLEEKVKDLTGRLDVLKPKKMKKAITKKAKEEDEIPSKK